MVGVELRRLAGREVQRVQFLQLEAQVIQLRRVAGAGAAQAFEAALDLAQRAGGRGDGVGQRGVRAELVEALALHVAAQQRLAFRLAEDLDQRLAQFAQLAGVHGRAVDEGARAALGVEHAAHHALVRVVAVEQFVLAQPGARARAVGERELGAISACSLPARTSAASARSPSTRPSASIRIDLPAPVSPVSTGEAGGEVERQPVDHREVADREVSQHAKSGYARPAVLPARGPSAACRAGSRSSDSRAGWISRNG